jgi:hypothetical protein
MTMLMPNSVLIVAQLEGTKKFNCQWDHDIWRITGTYSQRVDHISCKQ